MANFPDFDNHVIRNPNDLFRFFFPFKSQLHVNLYSLESFPPKNLDDLT